MRTGQSADGKAPETPQHNHVPEPTSLYQMRQSHPEAGQQPCHPHCSKEPTGLHFLRLSGPTVLLPCHGHQPVGQN